MASVVHLPGLPLNWFGGSRLCLSMRYERLATTRAEKSFPRVLSRPIGLYNLATL